MFINSNRFLVDFSGFSTYKIVSSVNSDSFTSLKLEFFETGPTSGILILLENPERTFVTGLETC